MPRAAMSVATSTGNSSFLKPASAAVRWAWLRLPWMRPFSTPCFDRYSASRFARCLVRVKTITLRMSPRFSSSHRSADFSSCATG